jgi:TolA-binding protein
LFTVGCSDPIQDDRWQANVNVEQDVADSGYTSPKVGEVDLVEQMGAYRSGYGIYLNKLVRYYSRTGEATKLSWARIELKSFQAMAKFSYLTIADIGGEELRAVDLITEADDLFTEANNLYKKANTLGFVDKTKYRLALNKFNELIVMFPTSNMIDDAAYKAGRIHEHFGDYRHAATYYQRTYQWNTSTQSPTRSRAAYILDKRLNQKEEALELYRLVIKYEKHYPGNVEFAKKRIKELTATDEKIDNDITVAPDDDMMIEDIEVPAE